MAGIFSLVWILFYILIYWFQPFPAFWNDFLSIFFTQVASLAAAIIATLVSFHYERSETPRRIWGWFAVALWMWFAAEVSWGYIYMTEGEVSIGLADVFWIISYGLFGLALVQQFKILHQPSARRLWGWVLIAILSLLALTMAVYFLVTTMAPTPFSLDAAINSFYPAADLLMAVIALWLIRHFQGGAFSRPWIGLLVFTFSDLLYAWLEASGLYAWSLEQGNLLTTITDVAYLGSYLVLGLGVLSMWLYLKYGLRMDPDAR